MRKHTTFIMWCIVGVFRLPLFIVYVTGTLKHVKSSVARSGDIVLRWSSGYGAGGQFLRPEFDPRSRHIFWRPWIFLSPLWPRIPTGFPLQFITTLEQETYKIDSSKICQISCLKASKSPFSHSLPYVTRSKMAIFRPVFWKIKHVTPISISFFKMHVP